MSKTTTATRLAKQAYRRSHTNKTYAGKLNAIDAAIEYLTIAIQHAPDTETAERADAIRACYTARRIGLRAWADDMGYTA